MPRLTRGRFSRGSRKPVDWSASSVQASGTSVPASSAVLLETFTPIVGGETVIRTHGLFAIRSDQSAASENMIGAFGIAVVTAQAVSVGITAIPHPSADAAWGGWFVHQFFSDSFKLSTAVGFEAIGIRHYPIDSKAMRKVDEDERLVVVIENTAGFGLIVTNSERFLSKVH